MGLTRNLPADQRLALIAGSFAVGIIWVWMPLLIPVSIVAWIIFWATVLGW